MIGALIIIIPILFQPELRRMLEELGKGHLWKVGSSTQEIDLRAEQLTKALLYCQSQRIGALVVLQRDTSLKDVWRTAVLLNADITEELLISIFWPGTPLHDGAVVIDQREIVAAGCYLPLTEKTDISRWYGTRHRAALGVTEMSDSIAIVVSEERGEIKAAVSGHFSRPLNEAQVRKMCSHYFSTRRRRRTSWSVCATSSSSSGLEATKMSKDMKRLIIAKLLKLRETFERLCSRFNYKGGNFLQSKMFLAASRSASPSCCGRSWLSTTTRSLRARCATK